MVDLIQADGPISKNLADLLKRGMNVADGIVLDPYYVNEFFSPIVDNINQMISEIDFESMESIREKSNSIKSLILNQPFPFDTKKHILTEYNSLSSNFDIDNNLLNDKLNFLRAGREKPKVSLRGDTTEPLQIFENIKGDEDILFAIKKIWSSMFSPELIFMRYKTGKEWEPVSILIQQFMPVEKSGYIKSNFGKFDYLIEAIWGLPSTIKENQVISDKYFVDSDGNFIEKISDKRTVKEITDEGTELSYLPEEKQRQKVLTNYDLQEFLYFFKRLNTNFKEVEWFITRNRLYINKIIPEKEIISDSFYSTVNDDFDTISVSLGKTTGKINQDILVTDMVYYKDIFSLSKYKGIISRKGNYFAKVSDFLRELEIPYLISEKDIEFQNICVDAYNTLITEEFVEDMPNTGFLDMQIMDSEQESETEDVVEDTSDETTATEIGVYYPSLDSEKILIRDGMDIEKITENPQKEFYCFEKNFYQKPSNVKIFGDDIKIVRTPAELLKTDETVFVDINQLSRLMTGQMFDDFIDESVFTLLSKTKNKKIVCSDISNIEKFVESGASLIFVKPEDYQDAKQIVKKKEKKMILDLYRSL